MAKMEVLHLTPGQRGELQSYVRKRNLPASVAQRMRIVLLLDEAVSYRDIEEKLGTPASTISRWKPLALIGSTRAKQSWGRREDAARPGIPDNDV